MREGTTLHRVLEPSSTLDLRRGMEDEAAGAVVLVAIGLHYLHGHNT